MSNHTINDEIVADRMESQALMDFKNIRGRYVEIRQAVVWIKEVDREVVFDPPLIARVTDEDPETFRLYGLYWPTRVNLDPKWDIDLPRKRPAQLKEATSMYVYAPCYSMQERLSVQTVAEAHIRAWQYARPVHPLYNWLYKVRDYIQNFFRFDPD